MLKTWEWVKSVIYNLVQEELRYDTDNITNKGWEFIDEKASELCLEKIKKVYNEDELNELDEGIIKDYFNETLSDSEYTLRCN